MSTKILVFCLVLIKCVQAQDEETKILNVTATLEAFAPKGFRALITANVNVNVLLFDGLVYNRLEDALNKENHTLQVWGTAARLPQGGWLYENQSLTLTIGQVMRYGFFLSNVAPYGLLTIENSPWLTLNGAVTDYRVFNVTVLKDRAATDNSCLETVTEVRGRKVCAGEVIFEDNFDTLREDLWQIEQYIPTHHPDHPFVSYQRLKDNPNVFVENGVLNIVPKLQEDLFTGNESVTSGTLDLSSGCTRRDCFKQANDADIIPPIVSGRLTSLPFSFKYGIIHVKAKLPSGDWLNPEILLEPLFEKYGNRTDLFRNLWVARCIGNRVPSVADSGNKIVTGGTVLGDIRCEMSTKYWSDEFHEYSLHWRPDNVTMYIDGYHIESTPICMAFHVYYLFDSVPIPNEFLHIILGVSAGGGLWFPDVKTARRNKKPWVNWSSKGMLKFWRKHYSWYRTWTQPSLLVDYVKVIAL